MLDLKTKCREIENHWRELEARLSNPDVVKDMNAFRDLSRSHSELKEVVVAFHELERVEEQIRQAREMKEDDDPEIAAMASEELDAAWAEHEAAEQRVKLMLLPGDPRDTRNTIIEIRAGTGGEEAALFARDLFVMYGRYADLRGWRIEILNENQTDHGGLKEIGFLVKGDKVYSRMKYESGTHRVQRVPATETQGRIHTSAVTVAVLPEAEDFDVHIREEDLKVDTYRSSGAGGQHVNKTESAVRITHVPTGVVVACQAERSQHKNRATAMKMLRARIFEAEEDKRQRERAADRKAQVGTGDRSGRIRTYNYPQNRLTDHRIGLTLHSLDRIMITGEIDEVIDALATHEQTEALKQL
jgi:peptide chain release factor 1